MGWVSEVKSNRFLMKSILDSGDKEGHILRIQ